MNNQNYTNQEKNIVSATFVVGYTSFYGEIMEIIRVAYSVCVAPNIFSQSDFYKFDKFLLKT